VQLFECTGIVIQSGTATNANGLTRFLTSARLFDIFDEKRNREDKLRVDPANYFASVFPLLLNLIAVLFVGALLLSL
jgi:hypothetical protein